jgi:hypothetical protein
LLLLMLHASTHPRLLHRTITHAHVVITSICKLFSSLVPVPVSIMTPGRAPGSASVSRLPGLFQLAALLLFITNRSYRVGCSQFQENQDQLPGKTHTFPFLCAVCCSHCQNMFCCSLSVKRPPKFCCPTCQYQTS